MVAMTPVTNGPMVGFTVLPFFVLSAFSVEYASTIFLSRAKGEAKEPPLGDVGRRADFIFFLQNAALVLTAFSLVRLTGPWFGGAITLLLLPAASIVLVDSRSIASAISPIQLLAMIQALGGNYWIACGFCTVLVVCATLAVTAVPIAWPFFILYSLYVAYAYLGYLHFYHQYELRVRIPEYEEEFVSKHQFEKLRALSDGFILFKESQLERAREVLRDAFKKCNDDPDLHFLYHKVLLAANDQTALRNHSNFLMDKLISTDRAPEAQKVYSDTLEQLPDFRPMSAVVSLGLAREYQKQKKPDKAIYLLKEFHRHYPDSDLIAEAYFLAAEIFHEQLQQDNKALTVLDYVLNNKLFPSQGRQSLEGKYLSLRKKIIGA